MPSLVGSEMCIRDRLVACLGTTRLCWSSIVSSRPSRLTTHPTSPGFLLLACDGVCCGSRSAEMLTRTPPCTSRDRRPGSGRWGLPGVTRSGSVSYTHLRAHETRHDLVCRLLL